MAVIKIDDLVKDYGERRGVFNVSFEISGGEVYGYLGPNGAGKTVTLRQILGFVKPDKGAIYVDGLSAWENAHIINANVGYLPGEISFPEKMTGMELIRYMAQIRGTKSLDRAKKLMSMFEINPNSDLKRMSKGMKQKIGIICAFMHDSQTLILDEPTNGLDPLMQDIFVSLIREEKKRGKTVLMSSHMFSEVEKTCDRVSIIKQGELVAEIAMEAIKKPKTKVFEVKFATEGDYSRFKAQNQTFRSTAHEDCCARLTVDDDVINEFLKMLSDYRLMYMTEIKLTLEDYFMQFYAVNTPSGGQNELRNI